MHLRWFRPMKKLRIGQINHRTHRKLLVVDEDTAFTGGVGIADEWQGDARNEREWRDTHFRVRGPAVDGLRAAFLDNWIETDPDIFEDGVDRFPDQQQHGSSVVQCIRGASETGWSDAATLFRSLLQLAEQRVRLTTAYFVPDEDLIDRICDAADRGVTIEILLPGPHADKRIVQVVSEASYERLLDCGVHLWSFQPSMLHAKVMTVDGHIVQRRIREPEQPVDGPRRGDQHGRARRRRDRHARPPLRRGPRAKHPPRTRTLERPQPRGSRPSSSPRGRSGGSSEAPSRLASNRRG